MDETHIVSLWGFNVGLGSRYHADKEVSGQVRRAWVQYQEREPEDHRAVKPYMDAFSYDTKMLKTAVINPHLSRATLVNTAVKMAGLSSKDRVLVVCGAEKISLETISALGHKKRHTPDKVTVTHPDRNSLDNILQTVAKFEKKQAVQAELVRVPFDQIFSENDSVTTIYNSGAVFVCQPMTEDQQTTLADINQKLAEGWQLRSIVYPEDGGKLFHLKGNPQRQGETSGAWNDLVDSPSFIPYAQIMRENGKRIEFLKGVVAKTREAIDRMADERMQGNKVVKIAFDPNPKGMALSYVVADRSQPRYTTREAGRPANE